MTTQTNQTVVVGRAPQYRLNSRGKLVIGTLAVLFTAVLFFLLGTIFSSVVQAAEPSSPAIEYTVITIQPGDSLWNIATSYAPSEDPRVVIDLLLEINELDSAADLQAGGSLLVPIYGS